MSASFIKITAAPHAPTPRHAGPADPIRVMDPQATDLDPLAAADPLAGAAVAAAAAAKLQTQHERLLINESNKSMDLRFRPMLFVLSGVQTPPYTTWPRLTLISPNLNLLSNRGVTLILSWISDEINLH